MISLGEDLAARLAAGVTTLAFCWRLQRRDGVAMGFTSHDSALLVDGMIYHAEPGIAPSAVHLAGGIDTDSMEVTGAIAADAIAEEDLAAGRYDGASVRLFMVDWNKPEAGMLPILSGQIGTITSKGDAFSAELRGPAAALARQAVELLSPECRATLGDRRCGVNLAALTMEAIVVEAAGPQKLRLNMTEAVADSHAGGRLRFRDGANSGLDVVIVQSAGDLFTLAEGAPFAVEAGTGVEVRQGCDKRFSTCCTRFANAVNFQGEPHVPGNDLLMQYPGL